MLTRKRMRVFSNLGNTVLGPPLLLKKRSVLMTFLDEKSYLTDNILGALERFLFVQGRNRRK